MTDQKYWLEVLVVVIEGAGEKRDLEGDKGTTHEMIWSNNQKLILTHLMNAEKIWNVNIVHGKRVGNKEWRDFIICGKSFQILRNIDRPGDTLLDSTQKKKDLPRY